MPGYKGHLLGGTAAFGLTFLVLHSCCANMMMGSEWLMCALIGSLFPDVDIKSKGQKLFYRILFLLVLIFIIKRQLDVVALLAICATVPLMVRHRGLFHTSWFIIALPLSVWFGLQQLFPAHKTMLFFDTLFFIVGALSHLVLDLGVRRTFRL